LFNFDAERPGEAGVPVFRVIRDFAMGVAAFFFVDFRQIGKVYWRRYWRRSRDLKFERCSEGARTRRGLGKAQPHIYH
jgi:hypothetical protein